jgi:hypothetical protein
MNVWRLSENETCLAVESFLNDPPRDLQPFDPLILAFCEAFSNRIFQDPKACKLPELAALAFWLRKSHLNELQNQSQSRSASGIVLVPRGVVFHIPPANVDPMFVYSWIISLLMGNASIIRLPSNQSPVFKSIFELLSLLLSQPEFKAINAAACFVEYDHSTQITALISSRVDVRMIWGGDETVRLIRSIPLRCDAKELVFVDRYSYAVINAEAWLREPPSKQAQIASRFFADICSFRQSACSSVKMLVWVGAEQDVAEASQEFYMAFMGEVQRRGFQLELSDIIQKRNFVYDLALSIPVVKVDEFGNELTVVHIPLEQAGHREHCGRGMLLHVSVREFEHFFPYVQRKDQTLVQYGFSDEQLRSFVRALNGKGILRIVKPGEALLFGPYWDGYYLMEELSLCIPLR